MFISSEALFSLENGAIENSAIEKLKFFINRKISEEIFINKPKLNLPWELINSAKLAEIIISNHLKLINKFITWNTFYPKYIFLCFKKFNLRKHKHWYLFKIECFFYFFFQQFEKYRLFFQIQFKILYPIYMMKFFENLE